ncbi:hypothetical protein [Halorubrum sp. CBA1229]|jgi:hypothetical protein|uniref:hypothetical protein n=1 Tax=Halorubrum sp. CBA1229 TaxID=1853699 RepID=UPI000F3B48AE|nr:hypothetical protein [Halorubrum sp. CBA1229]QKY15490.1 hypothetical protein Hrr1229_000795 [Halorubrum sp. CBA1229]
MNRDQSSEPTDKTSTESSEAADSPVSRRRLVAAGAATWASVSLAGCTYITDPGVEPDDGEPTVTNETTTTGNTTNGTSGNESGGDGEGEDCASIGRFSAGMEVGLHVGIFDPETGDPLGADAIDSVVVEFPDADYGPLELNWEGAHEAWDRATWGSKIVTDEDTDPGDYEYEVHIEGGEEIDLETTVTNQFTIV